MYLKEMVNIGVLEVVDAGREKLFVNPSLVHLLARNE
jgi:hypothetical protein